MTARRSSASWAETDTTTASGKLGLVDRLGNRMLRGTPTTLTNVFVTNLF
jgi:hypothetical protein